MHSLETYKERSALKLIQIGKALLGKSTKAPAKLKRRPTGNEAMALEEIVNIGPMHSAGTWAGDVYLLSGMYGEFNLPANLFDDMVGNGMITSDGRLTEAAKLYRQEMFA